MLRFSWMEDSFDCTLKKTLNLIYFLPSNVPKCIFSAYMLDASFQTPDVWNPQTVVVRDSVTRMIKCKAKRSANRNLENVNAVGMTTVMSVTAALLGEVTMCRIISISS